MKENTMTIEQNQPHKAESAERTESAESVQSIEALEALPESERTALEAAAFRRLVAHLQARTDVQNIDLMDLAGFCRNCLSKWYRAAAEDRGLEIDDLVTRERVYGMPYAEWKAKHQK